MHRRALTFLALGCLLLACAAIKPANLGDDDLSALAPRHHPSAFMSHQLAESTHRAERAPASKLDMDDSDDVDDSSAGSDYANAEEYIQTGRLWPGSSVSRVARRDPSSPDGGAQSARDDAAFDGNKAAQALAVAQRAEQQAQEVARMVSRARSANNDRLDGLDTAISGLKSDVNTRISSIKNSAQAFSDSTESQLSKFRAEAGVLEQKVTQVLPLADAVQAQGAMVKSISGSINSMRDSLNTLNFAAKEARQEANNRISAINTRISSISATAAQQSQVNALQAVVAKLAADQRANDARVSAAMQDIYASIRQLRVMKMTPGPKGDKGPKGDAGSNGRPGLDGAKGSNGLPGPAGPSGVRGATGPRGFPGLQGAPGTPGSPGSQGKRGDIGLRGFPGTTGRAGHDGANGRNGLPGQAGQRGEKGSDGSPGKEGGGGGVSAAALQEFYGQLLGVVRRASDASYVSGATVKLLADKKVLRSVKSQANGRFSITAPGGIYVVSISDIPSMPGVEFTEPVEIWDNRVTRRTYAVAGPVKRGQLRIVLTWGETPRDLDSHLDTPSGCHVFYGRKQCRGEASLDTDVTDSFGPETINIAKLMPGVYKYKVHAYSSGAIEQSEASVSLYGVNKDPITFVIGRDGQGGDWRVFSLKVQADGKVTVADPVP